MCKVSCWVVEEFGACVTAVMGRVVLSPLVESEVPDFCTAAEFERKCAV